MKSIKNTSFIIAATVALSIYGCKESNTQQSDASQPKQEAALAAEGVADNNVFYAKGEVIVFFEPTLEEAKSFEEKGGEEFKKNMKAFQTANAEYIDRLAKMGINAYTSREKNIKINVSESQFYVVHAGGVQEGYGVAMAKLNETPKVIHGIPSWEELEKEVKAYYKK